MDAVVGKDMLMAVLNELALAKRGNVEVHSDMLGISLMNLDLENREIVSVANAHDFDVVMPGMKTKLNDTLAIDLPDYNDLKEALYSSLLVPPDNLNELMIEIRKSEKRKSDPYRYPKQESFAIDTNIAYRRLFSRLMYHAQGCGINDFDPTKVQILLPDLVAQEMVEKAGKYSQFDIESLKRAVRNPNTMGGFVNCSVKSARKALNAQAEEGVLEEHYNLWRVAGGTFVADKEQRDAEIARALGAHAGEQRMDVLFLTADDKARAQTYAAKLPTLLIKYPSEIPIKLPYDPWLLVEFLHDVAVYFGTISLKPVGIRIMGEWKGKSTADYRAEKLRIMAEDGSALIESLKRDIRIIQGIQSKVELQSMK
ncbi:MAG: hypothetical protein ABR986_08115 [Methanomassiliicoccales archaeon]